MRMFLPQFLLLLRLYFAHPDSLGLRFLRFGERKEKLLGRGPLGLVSLAVGGKSCSRC